jgi:hypothetical protein
MVQIWPEIETVRGQLRDYSSGRRSVLTISLGQVSGIRFFETRALRMRLDLSLASRTPIKLEIGAARFSLSGNRFNGKLIAAIR